MIRETCRNARSIATKNQISGLLRLEEQLGSPQGQHDADAANRGIDDAAEQRLSAERRLKLGWAEATFGRELFGNIGERSGFEARAGRPAASVPDNESVGLWGLQARSARWRMPVPDLVLLGG